MSCCNFDGQGTLDKLNPETQRITEAIYSDWTEAAGGNGTMIPAITTLRGRSADDEFNPNPPITPTSGRVTAGDRGDCCQNPDICGSEQSCNGCKCMTTTRTSWPDDRPAPFDDRPRVGSARTDGPWDRDRSWPFDGGAVKKNWVPLVVLGLSLVVGIAISEWASKKYIK
jgi:hypothetical protein